MSETSSNYPVENKSSKLDVSAASNWPEDSVELSALIYDFFE
jgi:hypothetical protein